MRKSLYTLSAAVSFVAIAFATTLPAAANDAADKVISNFCDNNTDSPDCNDWRSNRASWSSDQYMKFYNGHRTDPAFQSAEAEAAFGLPVNSAASTNDVDPGTAPVKDPLGTAAIAVPVSPSSDTPAASAGGEQGVVLSTPTGNVVKTVPEVQGDSPTHAADCAATYKSYDASTDTYMGLSGERQKCKL